MMKLSIIKCYDKASKPPFKLNQWIILLATKIPQISDLSVSEHSGLKRCKDFNFYTVKFTVNYIKLLEQTPLRLHM